MSEVTEKPKNPKGAGRPKKKIEDLSQFEKLCGLMCTQEEIAGVLGMSRERLRQLMEQKPELRFLWETGQAKGKASIRRLLFLEAEKGQMSAIIFLAKNFCGMRDVIEQQHTGKDGQDLFSLESLRKVLKAADGADELEESSAKE